jgi:hypothetical protein
LLIKTSLFGVRNNKRFSHENGIVLRQSLDGIVAQFAETDFCSSVDRDLGSKRISQASLIQLVISEKTSFLGWVTVICRGKRTSFGHSFSFVFVLFSKTQRPLFFP